MKNIRPRCVIVLGSMVTVFYGCAFLGRGQEPLSVPTSDVQRTARIAAGYAHTCLLKNDGDVICWGHNGFGQLGGDELGDWKTEVLEDLPGEPVGITAGAYHTCILTASGAVYCWGQNNVGQLGDGTRADHSSPIEVRSLSTPIIQVDAGSTHTCALAADGEIFCWGENSCGQLGDGTQIDRSEPVRVLDMPVNVRKIAVGGVFSCALMGDGRISCWGDGSSDRFASGDETCVLKPVQVQDAIGIRDLAAGEYHLCAIRSDESIACWGSLTTERRTTAGDPMLLTDLPESVVQIEAGGGYQCVLSSNGHVSCWGDNYFGQLGDGSNLASHYPVKVGGLQGAAIAVAVGSGHACAMIEDGSMHCWGDGSSGQLGDGTQPWR